MRTHFVPYIKPYTGVYLPLYTVFLCFICVFSLHQSATLCAASSKQTTLTYSYAHGISRQEAQDIVTSLAYLQALQVEHKKLAAQRALSFGAQETIKQMAIVAELYTPSFTTQKKQTEQSRISGDVSVALHLKPKDIPLKNAVQHLLAHKTLIDMRLEWLTLLQENAFRGAELLRIISGIQEKAPHTKLSTIQEQAIHTAHTLAALWIYDTALQNFNENWQDPHTVEALMREALSHAPDLPALWACLGEAQLQLDHPQSAIESLDKALTQQPTRARALYIRALAYLRLQQPSLAEVDLNAALQIYPQTPSWLRARGVAHMMLENYAPMCQDFEAACALGDCEGLQNAREQSYCAYKEFTQPQREESK